MIKTRKNCKSYLYHGFPS